LFVISDYARKKILQDLVLHSASGAVDALLSPGLLTVRLFKSAIALTGATVLADLMAIEADFSGYAEITPMVWSAPFLNGVGDYIIESQLLTWIQDATTTLNTIYGWFIETSADSGKLVLSGTFDNPIVMSGTDRAINTILDLVITTDLNLGEMHLVA
jgi:hypothetical protein